MSDDGSPRSATGGKPPAQKVNFSGNLRFGENAEPTRGDKLGVRGGQGEKAKAHLKAFLHEKINQIG